MEITCSSFNSKPLMAVKNNPQIPPFQSAFPRLHVQQPHQGLPQAEPSGTARTHFFRWDSTHVETESARVAEYTHEAGRKLTEYLHVLDALGFPSNAGNILRGYRERPKLSDPAGEGRRSQPERDGQVRGSSELGRMVVL
jgi:hypothetical protein